MRNLHYLLGAIIAIILLAIVIPILEEVKERDRCYNLEPREFFNDKSCKKYWGGNYGQ